MSKVYLKDVVARIKDKVDKDNADLEYYIGGEHFDNGEIQITKKGVIAGSTIGPAFHMKFVPGDVLLMSRNPHLRKAGVVDFEGICSDVSYVCRTKDENVLMQRFLPFIFQSDDFWRFAEENKKGSTNFFLNWSDFEKYEFNLPPIETQRKLVEILWSFEDTKTAYKKLLEKTDELVKSQFIEMFGEPYSENEKWPTEPFGELTNSFNNTRKPVKEGDRRNMQGPYPYYGATGIVDYVNDYKLDGTYLLISEDGKALEFRNYDIAFIATGKIWVNNHAHVVQSKGKVSLEYLQYYFKYLDISDWVSGIDQKKLNRANLDIIPIMVPPEELITQFDEFVRQSDKSKFELKQAITDVDNLAKALMQQELK